MITDYCRGDQDPSKQFKEYVKQRGYNLLTVKVTVLFLLHLNCMAALSIN